MQTVFITALSTAHAQSTHGHDGVVVREGLGGEGGAHAAPGGGADPAAGEALQRRGEAPLHVVRPEPVQGEQDQRRPREPEERRQVGVGVFDVGANGRSFDVNGRLLDVGVNGRSFDVGVNGRSFDVGVNSCLFVGRRRQRSSLDVGVVAVFVLTSASMVVVY